MAKIETALPSVILRLSSAAPTLYTSNPRAVKYSIPLVFKAINS